jgi:hypothetical protein
MHRVPISLRSGIALAALASAFCLSGKQAAAANNFYQVPIGYTWDHMSYDDNTGDWNIAIGDSGFDAGEIPGNTKGTSASGPAITVLNNDPVHGYTAIPLLIGPTGDGMNNVQVMNGQTIPVVPGKYKALYVNYSGVNGPHNKPIILNYTDGQGVITEKWADWCSANQAPPDFFTWAAKHRNGQTAQDNNSCSLITKYIPVNPNRTLIGVTMGFDSQDAGANGKSGGESIPGDTITTGNGRTVLGSVTLVSDDASLGGYGTVTGKVLDSTGATFQPASHDHVAGLGAVVAVIKPYLGNYSAGANVDGTYTMGLPAGTYTLSAAVRDPDTDAHSAGLQATPVTVTVTAGQTVTQDIKLLAAADPNLWGSISGTVKDASGAPAKGQFISISDSADGPFRAYELAGQGLTDDTGTYTIYGLAVGDWYVKAGSNSSISDAVKVTVTGNNTTAVPDLAVKALPIGGITGTIKDDAGNFGGLGQQIKLVAKDGTTYTTTSYADPLLSGTAVIPETGETSTFNFDAIPAGDYSITLVTNSAQGKDDTQNVTVAQGQVATVSFTATNPPFIEGTDSTANSDALKGALDAKWKVADIWDRTDTTGATDPGAVGTFGPDGKLTTSGGSIEIAGQPDQFTYAYQTVPAGDFAATLDVTTAPGTGRVGLMLREDSDDPFAANALVSVTSGTGIILQGREATNLKTFPFGETAVGTDESNSGTMPSLPISLKLRKQGPAVAAYYSSDAGKTAHFIGSFIPEFSGANLRIGVAFDSGTNATADAATVANFRYASLGGGTTAPTLGDLNGDGKVNVQDATLSLRIAVGSVTPTDAQKAAGDVNHDGKWNVQDTTLILRFAVGAITAFP